MRRFLTAVALLLLVPPASYAAAAFGRTEGYDSAWPAIQIQTNATVIVSAVDKRPYVVSKNKKPTFVGLMRGGFGNPFDIVTTTGLPLADDIATAITKGFLSSGVDAVAASPDSPSGPANPPSTGKRVVVTLMEWKSDTFHETTFAFDITAEVFDQAGKLQATASVHDSRTVTSAVEAARKALTDLLSIKEIVQALAN